MSISRSVIVPDDSYVHVTWRSVGREHFLKAEDIKLYIESVWKTYKDRYCIKIFDYIIMDNHVHMLVYSPSARLLGDFMRVANSRIARYINLRHRRDGHALNERYKSPVIETETYLENTIGYIWLNHYRATGQPPEDYRFSSLYFRARDLPSNLLSDYTELPIMIREPVITYVKNLLAHLLRKIFDSALYEHSHTVGTPAKVKERAVAIRSIVRELVRCRLSKLGPSG